MINKKQKKAIICGGSTGLGFEISKFFCSQNIKTIILARDKKVIKISTKSINSPNLIGIKCDLSNPLIVKKVFKNIIKKMGKVNYLICVAGNGKNDFSVNENYKNYYSAYKKNFFTAINPIEIITKIQNKDLNIIAISSIAAYFRGNAPLPYSLAKNSLVNYCREVAESFGSRNIKINSISPGHIYQKNNLWFKKSRKNPKKIEKFINSNVALKRFCKPEDVISVIKFLCLQENSYITGTDIIVDGKTR